jgi:mannose-6-phosphate isomerase-like protein (cupin superfamily)
MAYAGQIIENPVSGETIAFRQTAADTGGELLAFDLTLTPDGHVPGTHVHPEQEERFEVVSGTMKFRLNGKKIVAGPGETVVVPAGARHRFANGCDEDVQARVEVRPALKMEELLETTIALAQEGRTNRKGMPRPLHLALFVREYEREVRAPFPPPAIVRALMAPLAAIARMRGHAERYAPAAEVIALRPSVTGEALAKAA